MTDALTDRRSQSEKVLRSNEIDSVINSLRSTIRNRIFNNDSFSKMTIEEIKKFVDDDICHQVWVELNSLSR